MSNNELKTTITTVRHIFDCRPQLTENDFFPVTQCCQLSEYLNATLYRKLTQQKDHVTFCDFETGWKRIYNPNKVVLIFNLIRNLDSTYIIPEDFISILEEVTAHHAGLQFLYSNPMFQERYIETVICRIYYDARCFTGQMNLSQFRQTKFLEAIESLQGHNDLNKIRNCFSYKYFYVLYCRFWALDQDHDLLISKTDLLNYNGGILSERLINQIMQFGKVPAFLKKDSNKDALSYLDYIWLCMAEVDKSIPVSIEYWFRCLDEDGDGIITCYDLQQYWKEQEKRFQHMVELYQYQVEEFRFDDIIRQLNDLIQPKVPSQFRLGDLKKNGFIAEKFFDTFLNFDKFQIHDAYQTVYRANRQLNEKKANSPDLCLMEPFTLGSWDEFADQEYQALVSNEQEDDWSVHLTDKDSKQVEEEESADESESGSMPTTPNLQPHEQEKSEEEQYWIWYSA